MKTWLFWDWWHFEHTDNVKLCQGSPIWEPEADYSDPTFDYLGTWPCVWQGEDRWWMVYSATGIPEALMAAESEDGIHWRPADLPEIQPEGEKYAPNHIWTVPGANGGPVYVDPLAKDGYPFKLHAVQRGGAVTGKVVIDQNADFHEIVTGANAKPYVAEGVTFRSRDMLHWEADPDAIWTSPGWHPDPPLPVFYNRHSERYVMMSRPGWGDRRLAALDSEDGKTWSRPYMVMQPDPSDPVGTQIYGMPVHEYEGTYVGFLWLAHFDNSARLDRFNQLWGTIDCQLTYSFDGAQWQRGPREAFIANSTPGQPGSGVVYPTALVEVEDELRIYSASVAELHHQYAKNQFVRKGESPVSSIIMHRLRKDGFMYLASRGNWATFITKPLVLKKAELTMNALAPFGEVRFQLTDLQSNPLEGFTFDDSIPFYEGDDLAFDIQWRDHDLSEVTGQVLRLEVSFRNAHIYAFRGDFHFADALDVALIKDGQPIDTSLFDN